MRNSNWSAVRLLGRGIQNTGKKASTSSFDLMNTRFGQNIMSRTGMNAFGATNAFGGQTKGGFEGQQERYGRFKYEMQKKSD